MKLNRDPVAFLTIIFIAFGCDAGIDGEREKARLLETDIEFSKQSVDRGAAEAFHSFLAEDAIQLPSQAHPIFGKKNIYESIRSSADHYVLTWEPKLANVAQSGDIGYTWGTYTLTWQDEHHQMKTNYGKYLNVWKKQKDGSWKVIIDMGNQSPLPKND